MRTEQQRAALLAKDEHRWVLIKAAKAEGTFDTILEAFERRIALFGNVPMLVKQIEKCAVPVFIGSLRYADAFRQPEDFYVPPNRCNLFGRKIGTRHDLPSLRRPGGVQRMSAAQAC